MEKENVYNCEKTWSKYMPFQPLWYLCNVMVRVLELYLISIWCFELTLGYHRRTRPGKYFHKSNFCLNGDMTNMEQNKRRGKRKKAKASLFANEILLFPIIPKASWFQYVLLPTSLLHRAQRTRPGRQKEEKRRNCYELLTNTEKRTFCAICTNLFHTIY